MWPFSRKKTKIITESTVKVRSVICIPITGIDIDEIPTEIFASSEGAYMVVGNIMFSPQTERHYQFEVCNYDDKMRHAFGIAGKITRVSDGFLDEIKDHQFVVYISGETGTLEDARHIAFAANAILNVAGIGIKIESTGKAFDKKTWTNYIENFTEGCLYPMFVADCIVDEQGNVYSCGMHNLGLKDTIVSGLEFQEAVDLISIFNYYQLIDKPTIYHNQTFTATIAAPVYRITHEPDQHYAGDELFENPYGLWRLTKA